MATVASRLAALEAWKTTHEAAHAANPLHGHAASDDPFADVPGWVRDFDDQFARTTPKGQFAAGGSIVNWVDRFGATKTSGIKTTDGRYIVFGTSPTSNWGDTSKHGTYAESAIIEVVPGKLIEHIYSDSTPFTHSHGSLPSHTHPGYGHTCVITPVAPFADERGNMAGGARIAVKVRADALPGFKGVILGWSAVSTTNDDLKTYGEWDGPEGAFNQQPKIYLHKTGAPSLAHEFSADYPAGTSWQDWHTYTTEWKAGQYVRWLLDGDLVAEHTDRIPTTAMHANIQPETNTGSGPWPAAGVTGKLEVSRVAIWAPA